LFLFGHIAFVALMVPYHVSFNNTSSDLTMVLTDFYFDIIFGIDMVVTFFTPIYTINGSKIYNRKVIAKRYLKSGFFFDLYGMIPLSYLKYTSGEGSMDE